MRKFFKITMIALMALVSFSACRESEEEITPSGNYSPIRGGFPQGDSELDQRIYQIKQDYGVYLLYKDVTEEDMNRTWESPGTESIIVAGDEAEREEGAWNLPMEHLPFYVDFFENYIFPNITEEFAKTTLPVKIYMIHNLREEPRNFGDDEEKSEGENTPEEPGTEEPGTGGVTNKNLHIGKFDNWVISFPEEVINGSDAEYILRQQRCIFMTNIIKKSIEDGKIVPPKGFWDKYDFTKSSTCDTDRDHTNCAMVEVVDKNADNYLYKLGFVDVLEEKFGTGNTTEVIKNVNISDGKAQHAKNWKALTGENTWDMFQAYIMNAMWFTPEEFDKRYEPETNTIIREQYDLVVSYMNEEYGIDLVGIANGPKKEEEIQ